MRIIAVGSKLWTDRISPQEALICLSGEARVEPSEVIVVHGTEGVRDRRGHIVKGFDLIVSEAARKLGMLTEAHPVDWEACCPECPPLHRKVRKYGKDYCPDAGFRKNAWVVGLGADVCLGFPRHTSSEARDCMRRARAAGIRVVNWTEKKDTARCLW